MPPTVLPVDARHPDPSVIAQSAERLARGELVAFPTETVYGLGADALNPEAVARIYAAKGRPAWNPVIAHVADVAAARALTTAWPADAELLAKAFWPGPLTLVLPRRDIVPDIVTAGLDAVAVRVPDHPVALALLRALERPIAAPSANRFTQVSPTTAAHVVASLGDRVPLVLDGGPCRVGIESTVVDLTRATPTILRPGMISRGQLAAALSRPVDLASASVPADGDAVAAQRAPGMADRHYAPRADVWLFEADQVDEVRAALAARDAEPSTVPAGPIHALLLSASLPAVAGPADRTIRMPDEPSAYARALYAALHEADACGAVVVVIEQPPNADAWSGVRDRLSRAAR